MKLSCLVNDVRVEVSELSGQTGVKEEMKPSDSGMHDKITALSNGLLPDSCGYTHF